MNIIKKHNKNVIKKNYTDLKLQKQIIEKNTDQ